MVKKLRLNESNGGGALLRRMNTDILPVVDFGCYGGLLKDALDDVFVYDYIELDAFDPEDEYYDDVVELVNSKYDGRDVFFDQVLRYAPATIQKAFDEYEMKITVIPDSCDWNHPRYYNYSDDVIEFDATVDSAWLVGKFNELRRDPEFKKFLSRNFSSRDGFISFMPDDVSEFEEIMSPTNKDYWKVVCAVVQFMVSQDRSIMEDVTTELLCDVEDNADYVRCSSMGIY